MALLAASAAGPGRLHAQEPNEKAIRILEPLLKRPGSGPLFERFVNAWLDSATLEELGKFLTQRVEKEPTTPNRLLLALFHARQGESVKALEQFRAALATDPGSADIWYQKALLESRTLDFDAAIASLGKCLAAKPSGELPLQASQLLGKLQARAGRTEEALKTWKALMDSRPADEELREDILELQIAESLWPAARGTAELLVEKTADPYRRVLRRMRLGDVLDRSGQRDKALETFAACLADTGAGSWLEKEILSQIEKLFRREDDLSGLRAWFAKLLENHAHRAGLQRAQARLLLEAGETDAAIACGRALMALSPGDRGVREEFIALLTSANRAGEAIPQVEQLLKQTPDDLELRLTLADLKHAAKDSAGALAALREYEQKAGGKEGAVTRVAGLLDRYGLTDEAVKSLRTALARADQPEQRLMLASLLHKSGDKEGALKEWRALAASGALPLVQQSARAMQAHGETKAAWDMMAAAAPQAEKDTVFLTQLCALADEPERAVAALPSVRRLVELSRSAPDLHAALDTALRVVRLSGQEDAVIAELTRSAGTAQAFCLLATLREAARDTIGANAALEKARAMAPDLALAQLVRLWSMRGDFAQAAAVAENLFNSPGGRQGHVAETLASLHQRAGNPEAALKWTREWRKLVPGAAAPVLNEARLLELLDREADALAALRSAAGRFEGNEDIRARLASLSLDTGRTAEALRYYSTLYEEAADLAAKMRWLAEWGEAAQEAGQLDNLIAQFEERRRENRGTVAPLMALAELHRIADNYEARRNALTEAARLKPDDPEIALEIARLESRENDDEAAIRTLRPMLTKDTSGRVASLMADLLINSGQLEEGLKLITESTAASAGAVELAALSLARRDEEKAALTFLRPHLAKMPEDWRLHFLAALLEWRTGDHEAAAARLIPLTAASAPLARAGGANVPGQSYDDFVLRIVPPDVQRLFKLLIAAEEVNPAPAYGWGNGYGRQSVYTQLPADLDEVQYRSAALLLLLAKSAVPEKREAWITAMEQRGFSFVRLYQDLPQTRGLHLADRSFDFNPLLRAHPDSRPLLAFAATASGYRQNAFPADPVVAEKAWAAFKAESPQTAIFLALPAAGRGQPRAAWEEEVLAAAEKLPSASPLLVLAAVRSGDTDRERDSDPFSNDPSRYDTGEKVPEDWQKRLRALLERWRAAATAGSISRGGYAESMRAYSFSSLARGYVNDNAEAPLAALLESEWRWQSGRPQPPLRQNSNEDLAQPLGFPPWFLPGLPDTLREFMQRWLPQELAVKTAALVKEPLLRVLLASKAKSGAAESAVKEVQATESPTAVPFILAAAWAEKRGDFATAGEQAMKALYMPVSQETRRRLDGALAYWASKRSQPGDPLYNAGREAALRLRRDATSDQRRAELATLMDRLGLTAEADRLMHQGKATDVTAAANPKERLQRQLDDGKTKEVLPSLVSDLRGWAREHITHSTWPSGEALTEWHSRVLLNGLMPRVMQALLPAQPTAQQLAEYAAACEFTGDLRQARDYYERALAGGVRRQVPQLLLSLAIRGDDSARALALLKDFPDLWTLENVRRWAPVMTYADDGRCTLERMIAFKEFMMKAVDLLPEKFTPEFPADLILELAGNEGRCGEFCQTQDAVNNAEPSFNGDPPAEEKKRVEAVFTAWLDANEALSRRMMAIPASGLVGWSQLSSLWLCRKKDEAGLFADGLAMLARELRVPPAKRAAGSEDSRMQSLSFDFMQRASALKRTEEFGKTVVAAVKESRSPLAAEEFLKAWPLYEADPDKFTAVARGMAQKRGREAWSDIITAAAFRELGADLAPDLKEIWTHPDPKDEDSTGFLFGDWLVCLEATKDRAVAEQFFHDVVNGLFGPADGRAALLKDGKSPELALLRRIIADLGGATNDEVGKKWSGFILRWVRDEWLPVWPKDAAGENLENSFSEYMLGTPVYSMVNAEDYAGIRAYLDTLPVMGDLPGFYCPTHEMLLRLVQSVQQKGDEKLGGMGLGDAEKNATFGRRLIRGMAKRPGTGVCEELAGWEPRIEALPEAQRTRLLDLLRKLANDIHTDATPGAKAFHAWLMKEPREKERKELDETITKFLQRAKEGELESESSVAMLVKGMLSEMTEAAHPRGREVIMAAHRAIEACGPREQRSQLLEALLEPFGERRSNWHSPPAQASLAWQAGLVAAALREGEPPAMAGEGYLGYLNQGLNVNFREDEWSVADFLNLLGPRLQPGEARLLMLWTLRSRDKKVLRSVEELRGKTPYEELRLEMEMVLRFHLPRDKGAPKAGAVTDEAALPVEQRHYLALLRDASLPPALRLTMGTAMLGRRADGDVEAPVVHEVARQLHQAFVERRAPLPSQEAAVFSALDLLPEATRDHALEKSLLPLTTLPRMRGTSYGGNITSGLLALLNAALRHGDQGTVDRLLEMEGYFPGVGALAVLVRHGEGKRIAALLKERPQLLQKSVDASAPWATWDATLAEKLPAAVSGIADPLVRFEMLAVLTTRPDPNSLPAGMKPHRQRCIELAESLSALPWRGLQMRDRIVDTTLWSDEPPPPATLPFMEEGAKRVPLAALPRAGGNSACTGFHAGLIVRALTQGNGQPLLDAMRAFEDIPMPRPEQTNNVLDLLLRTVDGWLLDQWAGMTPEAKNAACAAWRQLLPEIRSPAWRQHLAEQGQFAVLLHALAGRTDDLKTWHAALTETQRAGLLLWMSGKTPGDLLESMEIHLTRIPGTPEEKAVRLRQVFIALAANPLGGWAGYYPDSVFLSLDGATEEDFLKMEEPLTAAHPNDTWLSYSFARRLADAGAWDRVLTRTEAALKKMEPEHDTPYAPLLDLRTRALEHFGRGGETIEAIKALLALPHDNTSYYSWNFFPGTRAAEARLKRRLPPPPAP